MTTENREGEWVWQLFKDGAYYADRSMTCGKKKANQAVVQWRKNGFLVVLIKSPGH